MKKRSSLPSIFNDFFNGDVFPGFFLDFDKRMTTPAVNIIENKDDYRIEVAAPGLNKSDFNINIENNVLTISAEKEEKTEEDKDQYMRREFNYSSFHRSFTLPESIDPDKISAKHQDGILHVTLPKREEAREKPLRNIKIS